MTTGKTYEAPDWRALAEDALDLWQTHLTSLANDPRAKEEMAKMVAPMNQMFTDWAGMVQATQDKMRQTPQPTSAPQDHTHDTTSSDDTAAASGGLAGHGASSDNAPANTDANTNATGPDTGSFGSVGGTSDATDAGDPARTRPSGDAAVTAGDRDMAQLALRLATLERRFQTLETLVASMATKEIAREQQRAAEARRARREGSETASEPSA